MCAHDPQAMEEAEVTYVENAYEVCEGAEIVVLFTEWNQYKALDFAEIKSRMKGSVFMDLRNVYSPKQVIDAGF